LAIEPFTLDEVDEAIEPWIGWRFTGKRIFIRSTNSLSQVWPNRLQVVEHGLPISLMKKPMGSSHAVKVEIVQTEFYHADLNFRVDVVHLNAPGRTRTCDNPIRNRALFL
jgi:hypothetical protein